MAQGSDNVFHNPVHQGTWKNSVENPINSSGTRHTRYRAESIQVVVTHLLGENGIYDEELRQQGATWDQVLARSGRGRGSGRCGGCGWGCDDDWVERGILSTFAYRMSL